MAAAGEVGPEVLGFATQDRTSDSHSGLNVSTP